MITIEEITFNSLEELHKRLLPALRSKKKILRKSGYRFINETTIWNCMISKWQQVNGLALCDMVDDILNTDDSFIFACYQDELANLKGESLNSIDVTSPDFNHNNTN